MRITSTENNHTLLFASSEEPVLASLYEQFRREGYNILLAESAEEGVTFLKKNRVALIISDLGLPDKDGVEFIINAKEYALDAKRIILTQEVPIGDVVAVTCSGDIHRCVKRPWDKRELGNTVAALLKEHEAARDGSRHHQSDS